MLAFFLRYTRVGRSVGRLPATKAQYGSQLSALPTLTDRRHRHIYHVVLVFQKNSHT